MGLEFQTALTHSTPGLLPRRPVFVLAAALTLGCTISLTLPPCPTFYLVSTIAFILIAIVFFRRARLCALTIVIASALAGITLAQLEFYRYPQSDIAQFSSDATPLAELELHIDSPPKITVLPTNAGRPPSPHQSFTASVQRIRTHAGWISATGTLLVQVDHPNPFIAQGQTIRTLAMLQRPPPAMNPGQFDWAALYRTQRILTTLFILRPDNIQILSDPGPGLLGSIRESVRHYLAMGFPAHRALDHAILASLVLGDVDPSVQETHDAFSQIGTAYQLSVSGMHLAVIAGFVYLLCRLTLRPPRFACKAALIALLLYALAANPAMPILRSATIGVLLLIGVLWWRSNDKLNLLGLAGILVLGVHPLDVQTAGFQLGFITVLGLIFMGRPIFRAIAERDLLIEQQRPKPLRGGRLIVQRIWRSVRLCFILGVLAWLTSMPLIAYHFGQVNPWAIPAGLLMFPLVCLALVGGCCKIVFTFAWPMFAAFWARGAAVPALAMRRSVLLLAHLPGASLPVAKPSVGSICLYYVILCLPLMPWRRLWVRRLTRLAPPIAAGAFLFTLSVNAGPAASSRDGITITLLDIGAGQTAVVETPTSDPSLIDAGSSTVNDVTRTILGPFLRFEGWNSVYTVLLSHSDYDHISALASLSEQFGVHHVYTSDYFRGFAMGDPPAWALLGHLEKIGRSPELLRRGDHIDLSKDVGVDVLWPPTKCLFNVNNTGLVLRLTYHGKRILFPADIQVDAMRELLKNPEELKADVLVAAHHGSSEKNTAAFVKAVDPQYIVSSNGVVLTGKQKLFDQLIGKRPLFRTSECGAITIRIHVDGSISIDPFRPRKK